MDENQLRVLRFWAFFAIGMALILAGVALGLWGCDKAPETPQENTMPVPDPRVANETTAALARLQARCWVMDLQGGSDDQGRTRPRRAPAGRVLV